MTDIISPFLVFSAIQAATPLLLAALAGLLCSRAGVFNMALEGQMLVGAFAAVFGSYVTGSQLGGVALAMVATMAFSIILGGGATYLRGNPVVICVGMNLLASGLTAFLLRSIFGVSGTFTSPRIAPLSKIRLPFLEALGSYGRAFSNQTSLTYLAWVLLIVCTVVLFKTAAGLRIRGVGQNTAAATTLGINVMRFQLLVVVLTGALVGLAGAQLSLGAVTLFSEDMTAGRGWIALVAIMLARDNPLGAAAAALLFGLTDALGLRLSSFGVPYQLTNTFPYVVTLVALVLLSRDRRAPATT
ncbi:ABC transporter permease [Rhizobium laguerreae]|uniref:ABC transporter permease n=1 Tax=Rhizobium laguerreae TaxID=1076926 RepID=UPI001C92AE20|nr:ABC transporter permease [Rhizobium laguerreae]MBY3307651.1 ABC transporter permease [Rhizobium laguerreae]